MVQKGGQGYQLMGRNREEDAILMRSNLLISFPVIICFMLSFLNATSFVNHIPLWQGDNLIISIYLFDHTKYVCLVSKMKRWLCCTKIWSACYLYSDLKSDIFLVNVPKSYS